MRFVGVLALLVACGDNVYGPDDLAAEYNAAHCRWLVRCGLVGDARQCEEAFEPWQLRGDAASAHALGTVVMDVEEARRCVGDVERRSCDTTSSAYRVLHCWNVFVGTLPDSTACALSDECVSGECWFGDACEDACCLGTCVGDVPPVAGVVGDPCRYSVCREGWCDGNSCQPSLSEGDACQWEGSCAEGLACTAGHCRRLPRTGEPWARRGAARAMVLAKLPQVISSALPWPAVTVSEAPDAGKCLLQPVLTRRSAGLA